MIRHVNSTLLTRVAGCPGPGQAQRQLAGANRATRCTPAERPSRPTLHLIGMPYDSVLGCADALLCP